MSDRPVEPDTFRDALARWASGVSVVAVRDPDDGAVHAATVTSFASVSADPPLVVVSLGPGAQPLPFLREEGASGLGSSRFAVSVLSSSQRGLAQRFADPYPVGPSPFPAEGDPLVRGAHFSLVCRVERIIPVGPCRLVLGMVVEAPGAEDAGARPLLRYLRGYLDV